MYCENCKIPGHTIERCIKYALSQGKKTPDGYKCKICGAVQEHLLKNCPKGNQGQPVQQKPVPIIDSTKEKMQCYKCQGFGHFSRDCASKVKSQPKEGIKSSNQGN
jgi:hypothetical protein